MASKKLEEQSKEELLEYITKMLRPEMKARREDTEKYDAAFGNLTEQEKRGMLHIVTQFTTNRTAGAELFRELADSVLGTSTTDPDPEPFDTEQDTTMTEENNTEEAPAWAQALIEKVEALEAGTKQQYEQTEAQEIAAIKAEAREFGLEEGTQEWADFFQIAGSDMADGDLDKAFDIFVKVYDIELEGDEDGEDGEGDDEGDEDGGDGDAVAKAAALVAEAEAKPSFPKTGGAGGNGAPKGAVAEDQKPDLSARGVKEAARAFMENAVAENAGKP